MCFNNYNFVSCAVVISLQYVHACLAVTVLSVDGIYKKNITLQGSVMTLFECGEMCIICIIIIANFLLSITVKKNCNPSIFGECMNKNFIPEAPTYSLLQQNKFFLHYCFGVFLFYFFLSHTRERPKTAGMYTWSNGARNSVTHSVRKWRKSTKSVKASRNDGAPVCRDRAKASTQWTWSMRRLLWDTDPWSRWWEASAAITRTDPNVFQALHLANRHK